MENRRERDLLEKSLGRNVGLSFMHQLADFAADGRRSWENILLETPSFTMS